MRVRAVSGFGAKGPACFLVEAGPTRLLLDLGRGPDGDRRPDLSGVGRVDAVIVSHGHRDHVGSLDQLALVGDPPVYATRPVRLLADGGPLSRALDLPVRGRARIRGVTVRTGLAGHAPGGVWLHLSADATLLYSGDYSAESQFYARDAPPPAALAILDASYGGAPGAPLAVAIAELDAIAAQRPLLLPAPAAGRGLEMPIRLAGDNDRPVLLCPAHRAVAETLLAMGERSTLLPRAHAQLRSLLSRAGPLSADSAPRGIMVAAGADASAGVAADLVALWAGRADVAIVFTGHLSARSPAARLCAAGQARVIRWNVHPRQGDLASLARSCGAEAIMPAFLDSADLPALAAALPELPFRLRPCLAS